MYNHLRTVYVIVQITLAHNAPTNLPMITGLDGLRGRPGLKGEIGATGPKGNRGPQGPEGTGLMLNSFNL